jgi:hypothetical protein
VQPPIKTGKQSPNTTGITSSYSCLTDIRLIFMRLPCLLPLCPAISGPYRAKIPKFERCFS